MESLLTDIEKFDESLSSLLSLLKKIIKCNESRNLKLSSQRNPILSRLENYIKTYDKTEPEDHLWYIRKIYENNKPAILRGPGRDNWIKNGNLIIQFGEDVGQNTNIKIHLSSIYGTACKLHDDTESSLKGLPNADQSEELTYPSLILLHLYKLFHEIADKKEEKEKIVQYVSDLSSASGIKSSNKKSNDPLGGLLGTVTDLMGQMGVKLPEGQKMPSQEEMGKMLGNMMNNPQTKSMLGNVMQEMKECKSIGDVVNKLVNNLGVDSGTKQALQENLSQASSMFMPSESTEVTQGNVQEDMGENDEDDFVQ